MPGPPGCSTSRTGDWSAELCDAIALPRALLPDILPAGTQVGTWRGVPVHLVGGHDTASAVLGGAPTGEAFVSAGTWLLVGREQAHPDTSVDRAGRRVQQRARCDGWHPLPAEHRGLVAGRGVPPSVGRRRPRPAPRRRRRRAAIPMRSSTRPTSASSRHSTWNASCGPRPSLAARRQPRRRRAHCGRVDGSRDRVGRRVAARGDRRGPAPRASGSSGADRAHTLYLDALRRRTDLPVSTGPVEATAIGNALGPGYRVGSVRGRARGACDAGRPSRRSRDERRRHSNGSS